MHGSSRAQSRDPEEVTLKVSPRDPSAYARDDGNLAAVFPPHPVERFLARFEGAFELARFDCFEYFAELRARFHSQRDQVISRNQGRRNDRLVRELFLFALKKFVIVEHGMAAGAIDTM
jgi:hypothetical protein